MCLIHFNRKYKLFDLITTVKYDVKNQINRMINKEIQVNRLPKTQLDGWTAEWKAAVHKIEQLKIACGDDPYFKPLLEAFHTYSSKQFHLFWNGFDENAKYQLEKSVKYPPEYVLRRTLQQISEDITVLRRIWQDRKYSSVEEKETIDQGKWLATKALEAVADNDGNALIFETRPLCYFQKMAGVRVIPYANAAFIALPNTSITVPEGTNNKWRLLATAHEVGHHIYWHGIHDDVRIPVLLKQILPQLPNWIHNWMEELFADVFGALIGGEAIGLSSQSMMRDNLPDSLTKDDGKYPIGLLRPTIYIDAMREANKSKDLLDQYDKNLLEKLEEQWEFRKKERGQLKKFVPFGQTDPISLDEGRELLQVAIHEIVGDILNPYLSQIRRAWDVGTKIPFHTESEHVLETQIALEKDLYGQFAQTVIKSKTIESPLTLFSPADFDEPINRWRKGMTALIAVVEKEENLRIPVYAWYGYFRENNWLRGGPENEIEVT